mmetsp:Transcript_58924/g.70272  ORF Transcript_58924/g.70272 Transcript_58924/m.70272 type:complete len:82 (+) Transcript_58924:1337-1582(+)
MSLPCRPVGGSDISSMNRRAEELRLPMRSSIVNSPVSARALSSPNDTSVFFNSDEEEEEDVELPTPRLLLEEANDDEKGPS